MFVCKGNPTTKQPLIEHDIREPRVKSPRNPTLQEFLFEVSILSCSRSPNPRLQYPKEVQAIAEGPMVLPESLLETQEIMLPNGKSRLPICPLSGSMVVFAGVPRVPEFAGLGKPRYLHDVAYFE